MIYQQHFDLAPATFEVRDRFVELTERRLVPGWEKHGARLIGGWCSNETWFSRITNVVAFESLAAWDAYRADDLAESELEALCERREESLLEALGPIAETRVDEAIAASATEPAGAYTFAILEVGAGQMERFKTMLAGAAANLPILASWRPIAGNPREVIDLWQGAQGASYVENSPAFDAFFGPLREIAPRERMVSLAPLPYSPLR